MNPRFLSLILLAAGLLPSAPAADEGSPAPKTNMKEQLRARIAEDAKKQAATPGPKAPAKPEKSEAGATPATAAGAQPETTATPAKNAEAAAKPTASKPAAQPAATVLPKVEVKKGRITVLDQQLAQQDEAIAREKKNLKSTETDLALNDAKIAKPLAIFGGDSAQFRKRVASERVELMEAEKDLMVAISQAKTKQEKEELQKQLDELKAMRRELDKSLR